MASLTRVKDLAPHFPAIVAAYGDGWSMAAISQDYHVDRRSIRKILHDHGIATDRGSGQRGARNWQWRSGRQTMQSGYIKVRVPPDHRFSLMADGGGYVLEHRLRMAEHLDRRLLPTETVHHINGIRSDNSIENLQLRQGKHGSGVVMCCADCGSHNLKLSELA